MGKRNLIRLFWIMRELFRLMRPLSKVSRANNLESVCKKYSFTGPNNDAASLDIGCGFKPKNPFNARTVWGADIRTDNAKQIKAADLVTENIPFADESFDFVTAFDFLEHVPRTAYFPARRFPFVELMSEIYRVLKPNGIFLSFTPVYPYHAAFQDPTHVNFITTDTFTTYFDDKNSWAKAYGFTGSFKILEQYLMGSHLITLMRKPSYPEAADWAQP